MTHSDIYTKFMIEYDKANITSSYPSLTKYEIATILDKAYLALIAQKITGMNTRKAGFEVDVKAIEDLRPLIKTQALGRNSSVSTIIANNEMVYTLPTDFLYYVSGLIKTSGLTNGIDNDYHNNLIVKLINHEIANGFKATATNLPWIKIPVMYLEGINAHLLTDPYDYNIPNSIKLYTTYIAKPAKFALITDDNDYGKYEVKINVYNAASGLIKYSDGRYYGGQTIDLKIDTLDGQTFNHWEIYDSNGSKYTTTLEDYSLFIDGDITATAYFDGNTTFSPDAAITTYYTIKVIAGTGGSVIGGGKFKSGDTTTISASPNSGYEFVSWSDGNTNMTRNILVSSDKTFTATFKKKEETPTVTKKYFIITVVASTGGKVTGSGKYEEGEKVIISATPNTGYEFSSWTDGNGHATRTITVKENITYTAQFNAVSSSDIAGNNPVTPGGSSSSGKQKSISISGDSYVTDTAQFTANIINGDASDEIEWSIGWGSAFATISQTGLLTMLLDLDIYIKATLKSDSNVYAVKYIIGKVTVPQVEYDIITLRAYEKNNHYYYSISVDDLNHGVINVDFWVYDYMTYIRYLRSYYPDKTTAELVEIAKPIVATHLNNWGLEKYTISLQSNTKTFIHKNTIYGDDVSIPFWIVNAENLIDSDLSGTHAYRINIVNEISIPETLINGNENGKFYLDKSKIESSDKIL